MTTTALTIDELRDRCGELAAAEAQLCARAREIAEQLAEVREQRAQAVAALKAAAVQNGQLRPLGSPPPSSHRARNRKPTVEEARDAVCALRRFTVEEYAAQLRCTPAQARAALKLVPQLWRLDAGRYVYAPPEGPGAAFEADQRLRSLRVVAETDMPLPEQVKQSLIGSVSDKEVRKVVRDACQSGWELEHSGGGGHHLRLTRGKTTISVVCSPRNSMAAARMLRDKLKRAS